ncbi:MAG TPA: hypothetical protein VFG55_01970 [Rhodanobacteraceae bacterium]|nr:hypothetical protein [Rhodanobacteraceae bacterium]
MRIVLHSLCLLSLALAGQLWLSGPVEARQGDPPASWSHPETRPIGQVPSLDLPAVDRTAELAADARAMNPGNAPGGAVEKRLRVAVANDVQVSPQRDGTWETLADGSRLWRLTVDAPHATDLRFGFASFRVPGGVTLHVVEDATHVYDGPYTSRDASPDGQLWLPPVSGERLTLELHVPAGVALTPEAVRLTAVDAGYRNVNERDGPGLFGAGQSGLCNIDVICPLGDPYRNEIRAVAKFYFDEPGGTFLCTGSLVNDTAEDLTPYFLTANHCISTQAAATSMSLIWNYQSPTCGQHGGGSTADSQTGGATLRAHRTDVDFSLVELNQTPPADYHVYYAGWDATGNVPGGSIGIHHPRGWVKAITETAHPLTTMNSCIGSGSNTHWRTGAPYSQGTTEGGSSGSAIFVPAGDTTGHDNLVIGTLSGGSAACNGSLPNSGYDCYGKLSVAWNGSSSASRLRDWLDPGATGATTFQGIDPETAIDRIFASGFDGD